MKQSILIVNEDIELCLLTQSEAPALFGLVDQNRKSLRVWLPWVDQVVSVEDSSSYIEESWQRYKACLSLNTAIILKGELVGMCGFNSIQQVDHSVSIGYWLGNAYQGRGIVTTCVKFLTHYAFETLARHAVRIAHAAENEKSRRVIERCAFTYEGMIRSGDYINERYVDIEMYSILRPEWRQSLSNLQYK